MNRLLHLVFASAALAAMAACTGPRSDEGGAALETAADVSMGFPVTTSSEDAKSHFLIGLHALDMGRGDDARPHFEQAIAADPAFAYAYLGLAQASNSLAEFKTNLDLAVANAATASESERLLIEIAQQAFENNAEGRLQAARRLTEVLPASPRSWMELASVQSAMGDVEGARASLAKATEVAPEFAPAWAGLGNAYLAEPRDLARAQQAMEKAVQLEPNEAVPHDLLGDTYRAQGQLEKAAEEYTRTAELDPTSGAGFQQRGHVHSFLGNYDQARADYDAAIEIEKGRNAAAAFRVYRALVSVHEGNPKAAIEELDRVAAEVDGMGIPEPRGQKIFALFTAFDIALHHQMFAEAERIRRQLEPLLDEQAAAVGTEASRRNTSATKVILDGQLAAWKGDYAAATRKAEESMTIMEPSTNPRKNENAHALLGFVALKQGKNDEAVAHFQQADPDEIYITYHTAMALEAAGKSAEAKGLFQKVVDFNFNSPGLALVRKDAVARVR